MRRREFLGGAAAVGVMSGAPLSLTRAGQAPDLEINLSAAPGTASVREGAATRLLNFSAAVLKGRQDAVRPMGSHLGPILDLRRGERVRIHFDNRVGEPSIVHWHGLIVPDEADGHPRFAVPSGKRYTYEFTVKNPAGTYLYHPHPHGRTGYQMYHGLAGLLMIRDDNEYAAGLPAGPQELPLVIQDRRFDTENQLVFSDGMMDEMNGVLGDSMLVNGIANAAFKVSPRAYRLRVVNASNARIYKLAWSDGRPLTVIGTDNGLLSSNVGPQRRHYLMLGPTERVEILEDFGARAPGAEIALVSQSFDPGIHMPMMSGGMLGRGMMGHGAMGHGSTDHGATRQEPMHRGSAGHGSTDGGMMGHGMMDHGATGGGMMGHGGGERSKKNIPQGGEMLIARFSVAREARQKPLPVMLPPAEPELGEPKTELTTLLHFRHMRGLLNGREFEMEAVANDERVPRNMPFLWTFAHDEAGGMQMHMPHPMHVHGVCFRVVERERGPEAPADVADGFVDQGYKDSFLVFHGERVKLLLTATEPGLFMYHCHNLEHEDAGMMRNYLVEG